MSTIAMCCHDTEENGRTKYTKETLESLVETVDLKKHGLVIINNNSCDETTKLLSDFYRPNKLNIQVITLSDNIGTAAAINLAIKQRLSKEVIIKMDNDVVVHQSGWVEELEDVFKNDPTIGICGLKRDDVYGDFKEVGNLLFGDDIMGTCTAFNPLLLDKIGYMNQPSVYGFDDVLISVRSIVAGFKNCFLPHIKITHLDDGLNPYCDWKKREAGIYLSEVSIMMDMYRSGKLSPYYDGGFDEN